MYVFVLSLNAPHLLPKFAGVIAGSKNTYTTLTQVAEPMTVQEGRRFGPVSGACHLIDSSATSEQFLLHVVSPKPYWPINSGMAKLFRLKKLKYEAYMRWCFTAERPRFLRPFLRLNLPVGPKDAIRCRLCLPGNMIRVEKHAICYKLTPST